jgi:hypothetical protein
MLLCPRSACTSRRLVPRSLRRSGDRRFERFPSHIVEINIDPVCAGANAKGSAISCDWPRAKNSRFAGSVEREHRKAEAAHEVNDSSFLCPRWKSLKTEGANGLSILDQARTDPRISPSFELLSLERMAARIRVKNSLTSITELGSFPLAQQLAEVSPAASENFGEVQCKGVSRGIAKRRHAESQYFPARFMAWALG